MSQPVEYVTVGDTIADIANKASTSTSLTTTTSILLSILVMVSFIANALLVATILSSYKLRNCLLYVCFVNLALLNILDTLFIMFISILYLANGQWCFGDILCRINALMQQFIFLKTLLAITLMAMERALGLVANGHRLLAPKYVLTLSLMFTIVASCFAAPLIFSSFPVSPYPHRYLCAIASYSPIAYTIVQIWVYSGCLFVLLICFGSMIRHSQVSRSLPIKPQDYSAFIMETRALQDHLSMGKLVFYIMLTYLIVQGPYIVLNFFMQMRNSAEILANAREFVIPQDADTLITWLKLFFPLLVPLLVYINCSDIWSKLKRLVCCRRSATPLINNWAHARPQSSMPTVSPNVLTLVATSEGLQLRVPENRPQAQPTTHRVPENRPQVQPTTHFTPRPPLVKNSQDSKQSATSSTRKSNEKNNSGSGSKMYGKTKHVPLEKQSSPSSTTTSIRESPTTSTRESPTTMSTFTSQRSPHPSPKPSAKNTARNTKKRTTPVRTNKSKTRKDASQGVQSQGPRHWKY